MLKELRRIFKNSIYHQISMVIIGGKKDIDLLEKCIIEECIDTNMFLNFVDGSEDVIIELDIARGDYDILERYLKKHGYKMRGRTKFGMINTIESAS